MKRQYIIPLMEVKVFNTELMSITHSASVMPGPGADAPKRRTEVF
jgi:hypothetical protein